MDRRQFMALTTTAGGATAANQLVQKLVHAADAPPPPERRYDVIVVGLGAMGSACLYQLARRGVRVLGLEQFDIAHVLGSSGGLSRQTKVAPYVGGPHEPLIRRANELWKQLEKDTGNKVYHNTGFLQLGSGQTIDRLAGKAKVELLDHAALQQRFPQFQLPGDTDGLLDHEGGLLRPELAIASHCLDAVRRGAHLRAREAMSDWQSDPDGVTVTTARGRYRADHLVVSAGAWNGKVLGKLAGQLQVTRLALGWFSPAKPVSFELGRFPIWIYGPYYGFPMLPDYPGFKVAKHWHGTPADPDTVDRQWRDDDEVPLRRFLDQHLPQANGELVAGKICMYTHGGPFLGNYPGEKRVSFIAACNGGGFKFSSAYGEALADLATTGKTELPIEFLKPG